MIKAGPALQLEHVSAFLREGQSVNDVSLQVQHGELVAFVGSNSSGKGLALRLCAGLEAPLEGTVRLLGVNPARVAEPGYLDLRRRVGVIFDQPALISNMNVFNNVALPLRYHTVLSESHIEGRVIAALREWGIEDLRDRFPAELMLGDARLVGIARAQIFEPEILFFDDMLVGLDAGGLSRLRKFFESLRTKRGLTIVTSAGAPTKLFEVLDRVFFFQNGRLLSNGSPAEVLKSKEPGVLELFSV
jgi:phospholipid/cholesterol/gamma-HCH transport system ATP-binding protein